MSDINELEEIVKQRMEDPFILGRLASRLRKNDAFSQQHKDKRMLEVFWRDTGKFWRCTIFAEPESEDCLVQIDLHSDGTVRIESFEASSVTVDPSENLLILTRYTPPPNKY